MPDDGDGSVSTAEKAADLQALARSVVSTPESPDGAAVAESYILWVAAVADAITPWGQSPKMRDRQLRAFIPTENFLASALGIVTARNTALSWAVEGPPRTARIYQDILLNADLGEGWEDFITKISLDLYSQDSGAYVEIIRASDSPDAPCIGINHLDAGRCYPTGDPKIPFIYLDRLNAYHYMKYYQIVNLMELPSPIEHAVKGVFYKLQFSALTRLMRAAQVIRNISVYREEKTGGRFNRAIHLVKGITPQQIRDALEKQQVVADSKGLQRYLEPLMVGSVAPNVDVGHDTIEMASMPDGYDEEVTFKLYISAIAMAFLTDYQEFAPLPGGNLGTSAQSYILHLKSRGKGPALFQKIMSHFLNFRGVLPQNVEFRWTELDVQAETEKAALAELRAKERAERIVSGEITPAVARQMARDSGDLAPEIFDSMGGLDLTPNETLQDIEKPHQIVSPTAQPAQTIPQEQKKRGLKELDEILKEAGLDDVLSGEALREAADEIRHAGPEEIEQERLDVEDTVKERAKQALRKMHKRIVARMQQEQA